MFYLVYLIFRRRKASHTVKASIMTDPFFRHRIAAGVSGEIVCPGPCPGEVWFRFGADGKMVVVPKRHLRRK